MDKNSKQFDLRILFLTDCNHRVQRVAQLFADRSQQLTHRDYDSIYQEFDTLYGGARVIFLPELEALFSTLAMFARHLKHCSPASFATKILQ